MAHHAYFCTGDQEAGIADALTFVEKELKLTTQGNPDVQVYRYGLFSAEDARRVVDGAILTPVRGTQKAIVISASRIFHETQNILLKSFEEPQGGTVFILIVPSEGVLIPTLRSRLLPLPRKQTQEESGIAEEFAKGSRSAREKIVERILARAKKDDADEKQAARAEALSLIQGLTRIAYVAYKEKGSEELLAFLTDLDTFIPILHERAAPLKPILEHVVMVAPGKF